MTDAIATIRLTDILRVARQRDASDVHLAAGHVPAIRVDGRLEFVAGTEIGADEVRLMGTALLHRDAIERIETGSDISGTWSSDDLGVIRVHGYRTRDGITLALRLLRRTVPALDVLHLPAIVAGLTEKQRGLIVIAGPTGSGKSTTLAALVDRINATSARRIITIEDPIEYRHANKASIVSQREIGCDTHSYDSALIGALRADPDVIVLGEMRDPETMRTVLTAAETGHLVITTLHTGDAPQTIDRIVDAFPGTEQPQVRMQLAQALVAIVCQRLVPRAHGAGRRAVAEILVATDGVRNIVREGRTHQLRNAMMTGRQQGMQTLEHHLSALISAQEIDRAAALALSDRLEEVVSSGVPA